MVNHIDELEKLSKWDKGSSSHRGKERKDLNSSDNRESCTLGARLEANGSRVAK